MGEVHGKHAKLTASRVWPWCFLGVTNNTSYVLIGSCRPQNGSVFGHSYIWSMYNTYDTYIVHSKLHTNWMVAPECTSSGELRKRDYTASTGGLYDAGKSIT